MLSSIVIQKSQIDDFHTRSVETFAVGGTNIPLNQVLQYLVRRVWMVQNGTISKDCFAVTIVLWHMAEVIDQIMSREHLKLICGGFCATLDKVTSLQEV
jgi:hypothetical protein